MSLLALHRKPQFLPIIAQQSLWKAFEMSGQAMGKVVCSEYLVPKMVIVLQWLQWVRTMSSSVLLGNRSQQTLSLLWLDSSRSTPGLPRTAVNSFHCRNHFLLQWSRIIRISSLPSGLDGLKPVQRVKLIFSLNMILRSVTHALGKPLVRRLNRRLSSICLPIGRRPKYRTDY